MASLVLKTEELVAMQGVCKKHATDDEKLKSNLQLS